MKARIVEQLGETAVLMPGRIAEGLAANDRAKVRMSALQALAKQAAHPKHDPEDLSAECAAAGIDASEIHSILAAAHMGAAGFVAAPGLTKLINVVFADIDVMIAAVAVGDQKTESAVPQDQIESNRLSALAALPVDGADSVHRLVMDLHKVLNRLAAACAEENVAGAHAHGVLPGDKPMIESFMRGGGGWSSSEGAKPIEIAAKRNQRVRLPACPLNAGATKTCTCSVSGGSIQICKPGEACSNAGCGG